MATQSYMTREREASVLKRLGARVELRTFGLPLLAAVVAVTIFLTTSSLRSEQNPPPPKTGEAVANAAPNQVAALAAPKPKAETKKTNLQKTQDDAAELSALADKLRDELNKMNANVFSLDVLQKTEEVEKLAKKIKGEANNKM